MTRERAQAIVKELLTIEVQLQEINKELRWPNLDETFLIQQICHAFGFADSALHCAFQARNFLSTAFGINCWDGELLPEKVERGPYHAD